MIKGLVESVKRLVPFKYEFSMKVLCLSIFKYLEKSVPLFCDDLTNRTIESIKNLVFHIYEPSYKML